MAHAVQCRTCAVAITGQPPSVSGPDLEEAVTASLLRGGLDTKAARLFKALPEPRTAAALAECLGRPVGEIPEYLDGYRQRARELIRQAAREDVAAIAFGSPAYPTLLSHIIDPPPVLWTRGDPSVLELPAVAVVGSRQPTPVGLATAARLAQALARAGLVVTSGLARGIDGEAHRGALKAGGRSVAVLGCGADVSYPPEHLGLRARLTVAGCVVSELPLGAPPLARHFPLRNRLISGLSVAVLVVEAAERSGSLITARMALEQGRSVCAVPGNVVSGCHQGCHALIKDGARLVETVEDILEEISWLPRHVSKVNAGNTLSDNGLIGSMRVGDPVGVDVLAAVTHRTGAELLAELSRLELDGRVERTAGGMFVRLD